MMSKINLTTEEAQKYVDEKLPIYGLMQLDTIGVIVVKTVISGYKYGIGFKDALSTEPTGVITLLVEDSDKLISIHATEEGAVKTLMNRHYDEHWQTEYQLELYRCKYPELFL